MQKAEGVEQDSTHKLAEHRCCDDTGCTQRLDAENGRKQVHRVQNDAKPYPDRGASQRAPDGRRTGEEGAHHDQDDCTDQGGGRACPRCALQAIDARTTRHVGYEVSQRKRKRIEQCFGWARTIGPTRQVMVRGLDKVDHAFTLTMAAYNLTRLRNLAALRT